MISTLPLFFLIYEFVFIRAILQPTDLKILSHQLGKIKTLVNVLKSFLTTFDIHLILIQTQEILLCVQHMGNSSSVQARQILPVSTDFIKEFFNIVCICIQFLPYLFVFIFENFNIYLQILDDVIKKKRREKEKYNT